jgi:hypothetical protein
VRHQLARDARVIHGVSRSVHEHQPHLRPRLRREKEAFDAGGALRGRWGERVCEREVR